MKSRLIFIALVFATACPAFGQNPAANPLANLPAQPPKPDPFDPQASAATCWQLYKDDVAEAVRKAMNASGYASAFKEKTVALEKDIQLKKDKIAALEAELEKLKSPPAPPVAKPAPPAVPPAVPPTTSSDTQPAPTK